MGGSKGKKWQRPMAGFKKISFGDDGQGGAVACSQCGRTACFCNRGLEQQPAAPAAPTTSAAATAVPPSPALSALSGRASSLSVRLDVEKSPTFTFEPYSGYGNTEPPDFSLGGPSSSDEAESPRARGNFFSGGSPSWTFDGWTFALSATGVKQGELKKLIEHHGGSVSNTMHKRVHLLVATDLAVRRNTQFVRKARDKDIPMVTPAFVHDSLKAGELCRIEDYSPSEPRRSSKTAAARDPVPSGAAPPVAPPAPAHPTAPISRIAASQSLLSAAAAFRWDKAIRKRLKEVEGGALRRRKLRKRVLADYLQHIGVEGGASGAEAVELKKVFRKELRAARTAGRLVTEGKQVRVVYSASSERAAPVAMPAATRPHQGVSLLH